MQGHKSNRGSSVTSKPMMKQYSYKSSTLIRNSNLGKSSKLAVSLYAKKSSQGGFNNTVPI